MVRFSDIFKKKQEQKDKSPVAAPDFSGRPMPVITPPAKKNQEPPRPEERKAGGAMEQLPVAPIPAGPASDRRGTPGTKTPLPLFFKKIKIDKPVSPDTISAKPAADRTQKETISFVPVQNASPIVSEQAGTFSRPPISRKGPDLSLAEAVKIKEDDNLQKSGELYRQLVYLVEEVLTNVENGRFPDTVMMARIIEAVKEAVNLMIIKERSLLDLTYDYPSFDPAKRDGAVPESYIFFHLANVCILSLEIGRELGYNKSRLQTLGVAALLHDKNMHSVQDATVAENFPDIAEILRETAHSHFDDEQPGGVGYPEAKNQSVGEYVQLLTLADIFETMTHSRPDRKKKSVQQAIRELLEISASPFTKNALKILIRQIGLYPVGSWVELNTGEIARVVKVNAKLPLRPLVHIFFDAQRKKIPVPKIFNLVDNQNVYIKNTVDETELEL